MLSRICLWEEETFSYISSINTASNLPEGTSTWPSAVLQRDTHTGPEQTAATQNHELIYLSFNICVYLM